MTTRLTTILRRPDGLFATLSSRPAAFERPTPPQDAASDFALGPPEHGPYAEEIRPLADVSATLAPGKGPLLRSWQALQCVTAWNAEVLTHVLNVLVGTIADPTADVADIPALAVSEPVAPPRPTAAHPRAYRGTKYKPPKPPQPGPLGLRPHLCRVADEVRILERLRPHFDEVITQVAERHPGEDALCPSALSLHFEHRKEMTALPAGFCQSLLWPLRACDWDLISAALAVYWTLGLGA